MNALVGVRANTTGFANLPQEKRAEAARQVTANVRAKAQAAMKSAVATKAGETGETGEGERVVKKELDRDAFLSLLILQMQNQDPLEPVENTEMIAQLAQFSALEQMTNLNESFEKMGADFGQLSFVTAGSLVGRKISGLDADGILREGAVDRAVFNQGAVYLEVAGAFVPLANVVKVE